MADAWYHGRGDGVESSWVLGGGEVGLEGLGWMRLVRLGEVRWHLQRRFCDDDMRHANLELGRHLHCG